MVVYATMTPDYYMPGNGCLLQAALGLPSVPCFDIRQQCSGFVYGLQLADAHVRAGLARNVLLVGAEVHSAFMPFREASWARLAGAIDDADAAGRVGLQHAEPPPGGALRRRRRGGGRAGLRRRGPRRSIDHLIGADGTDFNRLYIPGAGTRNRPYVDAALLERNEQWPQMDGRYVFKMATTKMAEVDAADPRAQRRAPRATCRSCSCTRPTAASTSTSRSCSACPTARSSTTSRSTATRRRPPSRCCGTKPSRTGRIAPGDLVLTVAFGAGMSWGANLLRA